MEGENVWVNVNVNVNVSECCLSALARELGGARLLFTNTANAELKLSGEGRGPPFLCLLAAYR